MKLKTKQYKNISKPLIVKEGERHLWKYFHHHHYMTADKPINESLPKSCKFFTFYWIKNNIKILIGCVGVLNQISKYPARRITRLVVLPEYQGLGFSKDILINISEMYNKRNINMYIATFHPRLGNYFDKSDFWTPSNNNMKEFRTHKDIEEGHDLHDTLRDGVAMFRYKYNGFNPHTLFYDTLELSDLEKQLKLLTEDSKERKDIVTKIKVIKRLKNEPFNDVLPESLTVNSEQHKIAKKETQNIFKKNKRIPLTAAERKAIKEERKLRK